ncbi:hypothetical protein GCM10028817_26330 [Spirosoma pomorum]
MITLVATSTHLLGQSNYVVTTPNSLTPGGDNTIIGPQAGSNQYAGNSSVFLGGQAGSNAKAGSNNIFVGYQAGQNSDGGTSVSIGTQAGQNNQGGSNVFVGATSGRFNTTGSSNTFTGDRSGSNNTIGSQNTFVGTNAGVFNTEGRANTFIGADAGRNNTTGVFNTFVGVQAGASNTTGSSNFMLGTNAGSNNTTGTANFFVGDNAGSSNTTGRFNVFLGVNSGFTNTVGTNNTLIGFGANVGSEALVNAAAIGNGTRVNVSNSLVLGNGANVGIGTSSPSNKLHLVADADNQSGLRLEKLTSNSPASATSQSKFLTVDGSGNVVLGSTTSGGRLGVDLWQQKGNYLQSTSGNGVVIGEDVNKTPAGYRLYVQDGILTEKVKVAVKNASDWSDYVFEKGYKLAPLAEVEQHIQQKGHLPGVPSATEVMEQGVDVAKMDAKLLEKIEELTLYSIQLEKELKTTRQQQQAEIDELKKLIKQLVERK